jgi:hypothetical protein
VDDLHADMLNNMFSGMDHKPTHAEVARIYKGFLSGCVEIINEQTGEVYDPKGFRPLSTATVWNHLSKWENKIGNYFSRSGNRQDWMQRFKPYHGLNRLEKAGAIVSIDDRQPPFVYDEKGSRVWFYCGVDVGSEAFTSWVYGTSKEGIIAEFYRQMVRNYAMWGLRLPYELECESALNSSYRDTLLKEGNMFERVRIEANNARGKVIERYWRQLRYGREKQDWGWIARPFALRFHYPDMAFNFCRYFLANGFFTGLFQFCPALVGFHLYFLYYRLYIRCLFFDAFFSEWKKQLTGGLIGHALLRAATIK